MIHGYAPAVPQTQVLFVNTADHQNRDTKLKGGIRNMSDVIEYMKMRSASLPSTLWKVKQPKHMLMTTMITMATDMEKTMMVCFF